MPSLNKRDDEDVLVVVVDKKHAKQAKTQLNEAGLLHKSYRLAPSLNSSPGEIAIPLIERDSIEADVRSCLCDEVSIISFGRQPCPFSTSLLGNSNQVRCLQNHDGNSNETLVQDGVMKAISKFWLEKSVEKVDNNNLDVIKKQLLNLHPIVCPKTLQYLGDDKTLVIPLRAFDFQHDESFQQFVLFVTHFINGNFNDVAVTCDIFVTRYLWEALALTFKSPRVVRRGEIDPSSRIRLSEYKILWTQLDYTIVDTTKAGGSSAGWITITEQGIRQSFDLTKVMFSRGNITEKIRFGKLVQPGDVVLDMYAGIGYFTLPALVHGGADFVVCCEWNEEAVEALTFNLQDNGVSHRAKVLVGDCRDSAKEHHLIDMFDRVSLGLLPSSEGGWRTAVRALRKSTGGWLHVHGNVPVKEVDDWATWLCLKLRTYARVEELIAEESIVCVVHVEKVKSFAPTVNHYVADVFIGNMHHFRDCICRIKEWYEWDNEIFHEIKAGFTGMIRKDGYVIDISEREAKVPSCALEPGGTIYREWMAEKD